MNHTVLAPVGALGAMPQVQSQWMIFTAFREWSTGQGNDNEEWVDWTWSRRKRRRYRNGQFEKLMMVGLSRD